MANILIKIANNKKLEIERLKNQLPVSTIMEGLDNDNRLDFKKAISDPSRVNIIAEIKKGSPSRGIIAKNFNPITLAASYQEGGAAALSVLTEENYFYGRYEYVAVARKKSGLPVLCKDFIVDAYQIYHARYIKADCVLLICALHDSKRLLQMLETARKVKIDCLVEAHNEDEVKSAIDAGAEIIGVNNRNLTDFSVSLEVAERLSPLIPDHIVKVAESGITNHADILRLKQCGFNAFLIGEALVKSADAAALLKSMRGE